MQERVSRLLIYFKLQFISILAKKHRILIAIISIYFYIFLPISIYSQSDSLYKYLEIAAKNNPTVLRKFAEYQAALQKIPQVGSLPDPQLSIGVFLSPMELVDGKQVAEIRLMQMFPWFGVLKYGKDEMSLMAKSKFELFRDAKLQVYYDVQRKWYELYKIEKNIYYSEKSIEILKSIENLAVERLKTGNNINGSKLSSTTNTSSVKSTGNIASSMNQMNPGQSNLPSASPMQQSSMSSPSSGTGLADIYRIQIESGDLRNNIELLKSQKRTSIAQFNSYLNRSPLSPVFLPDSISADTLKFSSLVILDSLQANNPMLGMIEYEKQSVEARKKMVSRMGLPMFGIGLNYSLIKKTDIPMGLPSMNGKDMLMPMLSLTLPVYRKKYNAMKSEAAFQETAAINYYQSISNDLQTEYYQALQSYEDARRRISLYEDQSKLASKTLDILIRSYSASTSDLTEVLRARQQTYEYELKQAEAITDLNIATVWLRRLGSLEIK